LGIAGSKKLDDLRKLEPYVEDVGFQSEVQKIKRANKQELATYIQKQIGIMVDPETLFDIQVKRLHEYKRQHLNVLHIITLYNRIKQSRDIEIVPRTFIFGGKAAPGYFITKLIIKLINSVGEVLNKDPDVRDRLKVVFLPNYNVKQARWIYPPADLSEQISTAGYEASGTSNMKFALNGALTIGTLDGANIEIRQEVGEANFFLFGLTAEEVRAKRAAGYHPRDCYNSNPHLRAAIDLIESGHFSHGDTSLFKPLVDGLLNYDPYMVFSDYQSYVDSQDQVSNAYKKRENRLQMSILNTARMGNFPPIVRFGSTAKQFGRSSRSRLNSKSMFTVRGVQIGNTRIRNHRFRRLTQVRNFRIGLLLAASRAPKACNKKAWAEAKRRPRNPIREDASAESAAEFYRPSSASARK
jgi:glycogen phosphorylase